MKLMATERNHPAGFFFGLPVIERRNIKERQIEERRRKEINKPFGHRILA